MKKQDYENKMGHGGENKGHVIGGHLPDLLIVDDVVKDRVDSLSPEKQECILDWYNVVLGHGAIQKNR